MCTFHCLNVLICLSTSERAPPNAAPFVAVIVKVPLIPAFAMILGIIILALEVPLPAVKRYAVHRSLLLRPILLSFQVFLNILYYQVSSMFRLPRLLCQPHNVSRERMQLSGHS